MIDGRICRGWLFVRVGFEWAIFTDRIIPTAGADWALAKGETPEWVARTLGHVDTSMVYRTYSQYIPNLTRQDGSALEEMFSGTMNEKATQK